MPVKRTNFDNNSSDIEKWTGDTLRSNIKYIYNHIFKTKENIRISSILRYFDMIEEARLRGIELHKIIDSVIHPNQTDIHNIKYTTANSDDVGAEFEVWLKNWRETINNN